MEKQILVSIVLPVQGGEAALDRCVQGVLAQSESRWQLLLVGSSQTRAWAEAWAQRDDRIEVLSDVGRGRAAALRAGLACCQGTFTVFLDAEHVWAPDFLALTSAFLLRNSLEDMVCLEARTADDGSTVPFRPANFPEQGKLATVLGRAAKVPRDAVWRRGELARHLRWGEYTRLAVTLLRTDCAELLASALHTESAALDFRLQAQLAGLCAVNLLALPGALYQPDMATAEQLRQHEIDALAVFDEIHRRQWETDPELARLRRERLDRIEQGTPQPSLVERCLRFLRPSQSKGVGLAVDLGVRRVDHPV